MGEEVNFAFHAGALLENPAYKRALSDVRDDLARERDQLDLYDTNQRWAVSIAESLLTKLERRVRVMAEHGKVEQFHARQRKAQP